MADDATTSPGSAGRYEARQVSAATWKVHAPNGQVVATFSNREDAERLAAASNRWLEDPNRWPAPTPGLGNPGPHDTGTPIAAGYSYRAAPGGRYDLIDPAGQVVATHDNVAAVYLDVNRRQARSVADAARTAATTPAQPTAAPTPAAGPTAPPPGPVPTPAIGPTAPPPQGPVARGAVPTPTRPIGRPADALFDAGDDVEFSAEDEAWAKSVSSAWARKAGGVAAVPTSGRRSFAGSGVAAAIAAAVRNRPAADSDALDALRQSFQQAAAAHNRPGPGGSGPLPSISLADLVAAAAHERAAPVAGGGADDGASANWLGRVAMAGVMSRAYGVGGVAGHVAGMAGRAAYAFEQFGPAGAAVAVAGSLMEASRAANRFAEETSGANRRLANFSGALMGSYVQLSLHDLSRDVRTAAGTVDTATALNRSIDAMRESWLSYDIAMGNVRNWAAQVGAGASGQVGRVAGWGAQALDWLRQNVDPTGMGGQSVGRLGGVAGMSLFNPVAGFTALFDLARDLIKGGGLAPLPAPAAPIQDPFTAFVARAQALTPLRPFAPVHF